MAFDGDTRPQLPAVEPVAGGDWHEAFKVPIVACTFVVRDATELLGDQAQLPDYVTGVSWQARRRRLVLETNPDLAVVCARPNLEVTASDRIVGYRRRKHWRILSAVSEGPWEDE